MKRPNKMTSIFALMIAVTGCTTSSETFDCEPGKGVGCLSITKVNKMIDAGHFADSQNEILSPVPKSVEPSSVVSSAFDTSTEPTPVVLSDNTLVQRMAEQPIRIWIAPYQDEAGNFHEVSVVHSVIQGGYWQVQASENKS